MSKALRRYWPKTNAYPIIKQVLGIKRESPGVPGLIRNMEAE
jgi:hypothetical protein